MKRMSDKNKYKRRDGAWKEGYEGQNDKQSDGWQSGLSHMTLLNCYNHLLGVNIA